MAAEYPGTMVVDRNAVIDTRFTTLAPPLMRAGRECRLQSGGESHRALDVEVECGGEPVGVPFVAPVWEVGPGIVDEHVETLELLRDRVDRLDGRGH